MLALCWVCHSGQALDNGEGRRPPMGWNSWFALGCSSAMNASSIVRAADLLVSTGLQGKGYEFVNLDDCYIEPGAGGRDKVTHELQPANATFGGTAGIKALAGHIHKAGLKFGICKWDERCCAFPQAVRVRPAATACRLLTCARRGSSRGSCGAPFGLPCRHGPWQRDVRAPRGVAAL